MQRLRSSFSPKLDAYEFKRPPLRHANGAFPNGYYSDGDHHEERFSKFLRYFKRGLFILFITAAILSLTSLFLYVNCSRPRGFEMIPKTDGLCHDLYEAFQTGRISGFTWDYKSTINESAQILKGYLTGGVEWFKNFDLTTFKDGLISTALDCKDAILHLPRSVYEAVGQIVQLWAKLVLELLGNVWSVIRGAFDLAIGSAIIGYESAKASVMRLIKGSGMELMNDVKK